MYTEKQVAEAYNAMRTDQLWGEDFIGDIEVYDENDQLDHVATEAARAEERAQLDAGRDVLASARLVFSGTVISGNIVPDLPEADGETIVVSLGYIATTEKYCRVGLQPVTDLVSVMECARRFNVSQQAVSQAIDAGRLHAFVQPESGQRQRRRLVSVSKAAELWN